MMEDKRKGTNMLIRFRDSVQEMQEKQLRGRLKPLKVIRSYETRKSTEESLQEIGQAMETTCTWNVELGLHNSVLPKSKRTDLTTISLPQQAIMPLLEDIHYNDTMG
jgi:hypothetical protein